jgi:hypothetical protein
LLAHKLMNPTDSGNTNRQNDTGGWVSVSVNASYDHMGGLHPVAGPVLWADGLVRNYPYYSTDGYSEATWQLFWCWNRTTLVTPP